MPLSAIFCVRGNAMNTARMYENSLYKVAGMGNNRGCNHIIYWRVIFMNQSITNISSDQLQGAGAVAAIG